MKHGFSLVELSIVLVILGLLTGGILAGQNLIRAAELRSITTEFKSYQTAVNTFQDKYFALPGDINNATAFWGSAGGSGTVGDGCETASGTGTQTCNGNGDGEITLITVGSAAGEYNENYTFWQHLANAGLIEGSYTGTTGSGGANHSIARENIPPSKLTNAGWTAGYDSGGANPTIFNLDYGNNLQFGTAVSNSFHYGAILSPEDAWNIDSKIDDGLPGRGLVIARYRGGTCNNATSDTDYTATYTLTNRSVDCSLAFRNLF